MITSRCGLLCEECDWKKKGVCNGCISSGGKPFHLPNDAICSIVSCCKEKDVRHCGECEKIPCEMLNYFSNDSTNGDNPKGKRILQCKKWKNE